MRPARQCVRAYVLRSGILVEGIEGVFLILELIHLSREMLRVACSLFHSSILVEGVAGVFQPRNRIANGLEPVFV